MNSLDLDTPVQGHQRDFFSDVQLRQAKDGEEQGGFITCFHSKESPLVPGFIWLYGDVGGTLLFCYITDSWKLCVKRLVFLT